MTKNRLYLDYSSKNQIEIKTASEWELLHFELALKRAVKRQLPILIL